MFKTWIAMWCGRVTVFYFLMQVLLEECLVDCVKGPLLGGPITFAELYFEVEPLDSIVKRDEAAVLNCSVNSKYQRPEIRWKRDGQLLNFFNDERRRLLQNGSLLFERVHHTRSQRPHEGIYKCIASVDDVGTIVSRSAKLQIAASPRFDEQPQNLSVHYGDTARFPCLVYGVPSPEITWMKDQQPLYIDRSRMLVLPSGSLQIDVVKDIDMGQYQCSASNMENTRVSRSGQLSISRGGNENRAPSFLARPQDQKVREGDSVMLECAANGYPRPVISWLKDGATIDMADLDTRFHLEGTGNLKIDSVKEGDAGAYQCRAENRLDSSDATAQLQVQVPPRFTRKPQDKYASEKQDIVFNCEVYGKPEPTVQWLKNGEVLLPSEYFQIDGSDLKILGLVKSDSAIYQCIGSNPAGNIQSSAQLIVRSPDERPSEVHPNLDLIYQKKEKKLDDLDISTLGPSQPKHLRAIEVGTTNIEVTWSEPLSSGLTNQIAIYTVYYKKEGSHRERVLNTTSTLAILEGLHSGKKYSIRVVAANEQAQGRSSEAITVLTKKEPHILLAPRNLRAWPKSPKSLLVEWDPPDEEAQYNYTLYYMAERSQEESYILTSDFSYELGGLEEFTLYDMWVVANDGNKNGLESSEITLRTLSDEPSAPPQNVTVETASSQSIIVRWLPPPLEHQNGVITGYKIRYKLKGTKGGDVITTDGHRRLHTIGNLKKGAEYVVKIAALTVNGSGPAIDWISCKTYKNDLDESTVPGSPASIKARPMPTQITVMWTPPKDKSVKVRGYTIGYGVGLPDVYQKIVDHNQRIYTIDGLIANSEYVISLRAFNNMGDGRPIYEGVKTRKEVAAEPLEPLTPPLGLKAMVLDHKSVVLSWSDTSLTEEVERNQDVSESRTYTIQYRSLVNQKYRHENTTKLTFVIDDLKPNTRYEFSVKVTEGRRKSGWSILAFNTTFESRPGSHPRDLTVAPQTKNPTSVDLMWQPPKQPNGRITGYLILYNTNPNQPDRNWVVSAVVGDKLTTTIKGLTPETTYYFKIHARNRKGSGPFSEKVAFTTGVGYGDVAEAGISVVYIVIGSLAVVAAFLFMGLLWWYCRKRDQKSHLRKGYVAGTATKGGKLDVKPPDLWIHHDQMELKAMEKGGVTHTTLSRHSQELEPEDKMDYGGGTLKRTADPYPGDTLSRELEKGLSNRRPIKPKPIMIPVDTQPPKEPIATATAIPNGSILPERSYRAGVARAHVTVTPNVSSPENPYCGPPPPSFSVIATTKKAAGNDGSLKRGQGHPLKSFAVPPAPPPGGVTAGPHTPTQKHIVRPAISANSSPQKKHAPLSMSTPTSSLKGRGNKGDMKPSYSTEELNQEMANLEGLMKDLNAITASEFEC